jgi:phosphoribosyl 1,2-cyclic phosphate phosphodiesterase
VGGFAYSTDLVRLGEEALATLTGVDTWLVSCFQRVPHLTHADLAQVLAWRTRIGARRTVLTHMGIDMDYASLAAELPAGVEPGVDGMVLDVK